MKLCSFALLVALSAATLALVPAPAARAEMVFSGYTQARFNLMDSALDKPNEFDLRRTRLKYSGTVSSRGTEATIQIDLAKLDDRQDDKDPRNRRVVLKDAFVRHPFNSQWAARMGYTTIPFGFEEEYSSSKRLPLERSKAATSFFPGERENGLYFLYKPPDRRQPEVVFGYSNGMYEWGDRASNGDQDKKDHAWTGRVQWPLPRQGVAGLSYTSASRQREVGGERRDLDQNCWGAHVRYHAPRGLNLQAEYYDGEILSVESKGWYAQVEYAPGLNRVMPFYRHDVFDDGIAGHQTYRRHTLGVAYDQDKQERFTLQWERYDDLKGGSYNNWGLQYQVKYGGK